MIEPVGEGPPSSFLDSLGDRGRRRAEPRTSIALAGAGCALGILGVLVVAGDTGLDESSGEFNQVPGVLLSGLVVIAGFFVLANARRGPVATAGAVAATLGVPPLMFFLTFDENSSPPYSTEAILIASTVVALGAYVIGPGRGRPFFLGAGLLWFWFTVLQVIEKVFTAPWDQSFGFSGPVSGFDDTSQFDDTIELPGDIGAPDSSDPATVGLLSLALGVAFVLTSRWLDRTGRHGTATPFAVIALPCLFVGVVGLAPDLEAAGSGLLMVLIGLALAYNGASVWRRATTWIGGGVTAVGLGIFLGDMSGDDATVGGMLFIAGGISMVLAGHALAAALREPDEMAVTLGLAPGGAGPLRRVAPPEPEGDPPAGDDSHWAPPLPTPPLPPPPPPPT